MCDYCYDERSCEKGSLKESIDKIVYRIVENKINGR